MRVSCTRSVTVPARRSGVRGRQLFYRAAAGKRVALTIDQRKRIKVELKDLKFRIMDSLFAVGDTYLAELEAARESEKRKVALKKARDGSRKMARRKKEKGLRETAPWV